MKLRWLYGIIALCVMIGLGFGLLFRHKPTAKISQAVSAAQQILGDEQNALQISALQNRTYPGSNLTIEKNVSDNASYRSYIVSYLSDGLKIYALLTVPKGNKPKNGWPVIVFNHGYIPPQQYQTTQRYVAYVDAFARHGYIVIKPDFRGNGQSEGSPDGAYFSPAYTIDSLNALASVKKYPDADPNRIGMWGHSMGGFITLRSLVVSKDIKAAVIWAGVVGTYDDIINHWQNRVRYHPAPQDLALRNHNREQLLQQYGTPTSNPQFWNSIDPNAHLENISAPIQLNVGLADQEVPPDFSTNLKNRLQQLGKPVEYYEYPGADHNISGSSFTKAMQRSLSFFDKNL